MSTRISAVVCLDIHPRKGQSAADAATEFQATFREYLESTENPFRGDYGTTAEAIKAAGDNPDAELTWGGYEGPYVTGVKVTPA